MCALISICIPAYKQPQFLRTCLQSIAQQTYKQVEVIITDDSPDTSVKVIADEFKSVLNLQYFKNEAPLGPPANWNEAIKKASGTYFMLLHHDDKLSTEHSLEKYLQPFLKDPTVDFVFGRNVTIDKMTSGAFDHHHFNSYYKNPYLLIARQTIGPPSNLMLKRSIPELYDVRYKWVVDIDYYFRLFKGGRKFYYVDEHLIGVGIHADQVTNDCITNPDVLIYENVSFAVDHLQKINSIVVFDFYWRLLRNNGVRSLQQVTSLGIAQSSIPKFIKTIVGFQKRLPKGLNKGALSKLFMSLAYASR